jgi:lipoate-protein ligase B
VSWVVHLEGLTPYPAAHALQEALVAARIAGQGEDLLLFLEHPPTITLGKRRGAESNVLQGGDVPVVAVARGGDATWHGPGQLVAYPIVALKGERQDLHAHLHALEDAVIGLLAELGVTGRRDARNTGVWLEGASGEARKLCSIGVACRGWVSWHGLALNLDVDLGGFARIRPCGFGAEVMTRLADHLQPCPDVTSLAPRLVPHLIAALRLSPPSRTWRGVLRAEGEVGSWLERLGLALQPGPAPTA